MPRRAACRNDDLFRFRQDLIIQPGGREINSSVFNNAVESIPHSLRLFVDLLDHKVLETTFFRSFRIPGDLRRRYFDFIPVEVKEMYFSREYSGGAKIFYIIHAAGIFQNSRNV